MHIFLGIVMVLFSLFLGTIGYLIAMRGKYALINNFIMQRNAGKADNAYARRVGWIELFAAVYFLLFGILALCINSTGFALTVLIIGVVLLTAAALLNLFLGKRRA